MKLWSVAPLDKEKAREIQNKYGLPAIIAMLLQIRNITTQSEIEDFLSDNISIDNPFEIKDMDRAVARIRRAIDSLEPICVYGDYDADGVTSTALLYSYLEASGANAMYYIPSREGEGYGLNKSAVDRLNEQGIRLIITVDNGIAAADIIAYAAELGIDTVVTDHHMPSGDLPNACAVVDLHRADCNSRFKSLSGVGVAFKLIMALEGEYCDVQALLDNYSDLLCIGTIGDIVELRGENRVFVKQGIESIMNTDRAGIAALVEECGLSDKKLTAGNISFAIVPRINAVGRLGESGKSVSLLLTEDIDEAREISAHLCDDNAERQQIEKEILAKIDDQIKRNPSIILNKIIVIDGENWHQGVIGIVASRIKEAYGKPAIIISRYGDSAKASGRSIAGFPLCDALFSCSDLLTHYGGHPMAVGFSLDSKNIELFCKRINAFADSFGDMPYDKLNIDFKLNPAYINVDLVNSISYMQPYGAGNPTPVFGLFNMTLKNIIPLSNNKHLKLVLTRDNTTLSVMNFFTSTDTFPFVIGDRLDCAVTLDLNEYNGNTSVSIVIRDIKPASFDTAACLESLRNFESFCCGNSLSRSQILDLLPDRNDFALLYRFLRQNGGYSHPIHTLNFRLDNKLSFGKIRVILESMNELGLIEIIEGINTSNIRLLPQNGKVSIDSAGILKRLREVL